ALVQRLVQARLVERRTDPDDRRLRRVELTSTGRAQLEEASRGLHDTIARLTDTRDTGALERLLDDLAAGPHPLAAEPRPPPPPAPARDPARAPVGRPGAAPPAPPGPGLPRATAPRRASHGRRSTITAAPALAGATPASAWRISIATVVPTSPDTGPSVAPRA